MFREDPFYRLCRLRHTIPPLRERMDQLPELIDVLADQIIALETMKGVQRFTEIQPAVLKLLRDYHWPGNVRELKGTIEQGLIHSRGETIEPRHLPPDVRNPREKLRIWRAGDAPSSKSGGWAQPPKRYVAPASVDEERAVGIQALRDADGNKTHAATRLGMSRQPLRVKLLEHRITPPEREDHQEKMRRAWPQPEIRGVNSTVDGCIARCLDSV
ncbi:hypothetical protein BH23GEM3_BH23GEM3_15640 [soil metagenome]|nr:hypothetical protein [Gemmatimonadota bacterium]